MELAPLWSTKYEDQASISRINKMNSDFDSNILNTKCGYWNLSKSDCKSETSVINHFTQYRLIGIRNVINKVSLNRVPLYYTIIEVQIHT